MVLYRFFLWASPLFCMACANRHLAWRLQDYHDERKFWTSLIHMYIYINIHIYIYTIPSSIQHCPSQKDLQSLIIYVSIRLHQDTIGKCTCRRPQGMAGWPMDSWLVLSHTLVSASPPPVISFPWQGYQWIQRVQKSEAHHDHHLTYPIDQIWLDSTSHSGFGLILWNFVHWESYHW